MIIKRYGTRSADGTYLVPANKPCKYAVARRLFDKWAYGRPIPLVANGAYCYRKWLSKHIRKHGCD